ncbi:MAG: hypothetical protein COA70_03925 [Planctomycetota bacterium]|nr:MAG: hypothetical protein COA70_03925 [Planctomycetota bacterium]
MVKVWFDAKVLSHQSLLEKANATQGNRHVWDSRQAKEAGFRLDGEQKYYLLQSPLRNLALSETQASRVNASLKGDWRQYLSPSQLKRAEQLLHPKKK